MGFKQKIADNSFKAVYDVPLSAGFLPDTVPENLVLLWQETRLSAG